MEFDTHTNLSVGIKYSVRDLNCGVSYCSWPVKMRHWSAKRGWRPRSFQASVYLSKQLPHNWKFA